MDNNMITISPFEEKDWDNLWHIIKPVFRAGESYPYSTKITKDEARRAWIDAPLETYVVKNNSDEILGTYYIKPNQPGLGGHVCNCGYVVAENSRGQGIASKMCKHSQLEASTLGFRDMQYNLVVSTNEVAIQLWQKQGFEIIGTLPGAFNHSRHGYVDAYVMFKTLVPKT